MQAHWYASVSSILCYYSDALHNISNSIMAATQVSTTIDVINVQKEIKNVKNVTNTEKIKKNVSKHLTKNFAKICKCLCKSV